MVISDRDRRALERLCRDLAALPYGDGGSTVALNDSQWHLVGEALKAYLGQHEGTPTTAGKECAMFTLRWTQRDDTFELKGKIGAVRAAVQAFASIPDSTHNGETYRWDQPHDVALFDEDGSELDPDTLAAKHG